MGANMNFQLHEISITPLSRIKVNGGDVLRALKHSDIGFSSFGEAYFSWVDVGVIKAWKLHKLMVMNFLVPLGNVRFVFTIDGTNFRSIEIGENCYARVTVPPGVWFGFKNIHIKNSLVLNIANIEHDPMEVSRKDISEIIFDWD